MMQLIIVCVWDVDGNNASVETALRVTNKKYVYRLVRNFRRRSILCVLLGRTLTAMTPVWGAYTVKRGEYFC